MINLFEKEIAYLDDIHIEAAKAKARDLFRKRDDLMNDPRQDDNGGSDLLTDSPATKWLDDICANSEALLRVYIDHLTTKEWLFEQLTEQAPHCLLDVKGQEAMFYELRAWAEA